MISPQLKTDRLILDPWSTSDWQAFKPIATDPEVMRYITGGRSTPREEVRDEIIAFHLDFYGRCDQFGTWAAEARSTGDFLGWFHFRPGPRRSADLGYRLRRAAWNLGYATEGSRALIHKGFTDLGVQRVYARAWRPTPRPGA